MCFWWKTTGEVLFTSSLHWTATIGHCPTSILNCFETMQAVSVLNPRFQQNIPPPCICVIVKVIYHILFHFYSSNWREVQFQKVQTTGIFYCHQNEKVWVVVPLGRVRIGNFTDIIELLRRLLRSLGESQIKFHTWNW